MATVVCGRGARARFVSAVIAYFLVFTGLSGLTATVWATDDIQGVWEGRYICRQGPTGLTLTIEGSDPSRLTARFKFYPVPENPRVPHGELEMTGKFDPRVGHFQFRPGRWIQRPRGYATVGLSGLLESSGRLTGRLPVSGCQAFTLSRASSAPSRQAATPAAPRRNIPKSLSAARTLSDKCEVLLAWVARMKSEYPGLAPYRTSSTVLGPKIVNLYRNQFFVPVFGNPFDKTTESWRKGFFREVILACARSREGQPSYRDRFNDYYTFFFRPFSLPRGWLSYADVSSKLAALRITEEWRRRVLKAAEDMHASAANLREIDSYLTQGRKDLSELWPSEKAEFKRKLVARKQTLAASLVATATKQTDELTASLANAARLTTALKEVQDFAASLPADLRRSAVDTLNGRLEAMVQQLVEQDLAALQALSQAAKPAELARWLADFDRKYKPYAKLKPYSDAIALYRDKRNGVFETGLAAYRAQLNSLPMSRDSLQAAARLLHQTFVLKNDEQLPAYEKYKSATLARIANIRKALAASIDQDQIPAQSCVDEQQGCGTSHGSSQKRAEASGRQKDESGESVSVPREYQKTFDRIHRREAFRFDNNSFMFTAGIAIELMKKCNVPSGTSDRLELAEFVQGALLRAGVGPNYSNPDPGATTGEQSALLAGVLTARSLGCREPAASKLADGVVAVVKSNKAGSGDGKQPVFVRTCQRQFSRDQCECLASLGRGVRPNIYQMEYHRDIIVQIISRNPLLGLQIGVRCRIYKY